MARNYLLAVIAALCLSAAAANYAEDLVEGSSGVIGGAMSLAKGGYLNDDAEELVMEVGPVAENQTLLFIEQYEEATDKKLAVKTIKVASGVVGGLKAMSEGAKLIDDAMSEVDGLSEDKFKKASNNTYFHTMQKLNDNLVLLSKAVEDSFSEVASAESTGNRKLLQSSYGCDSDSTDAELEQCYLDALSLTSTSLQKTSNSIYANQYNYYCKPYIRETYSDDLEEDFNDDKTMKTCNDFSFFGVFGSTRCSECISHFSEDVGGLLTQEDCDIFSADEQRWFLDDMGSGKFMMRNEEEKSHCVTAPTTSSIYSSQYYTLQKCDETNKAQHFNVLELDTWTSDPRIVMRLAGSETTTNPGGLCMTTLEDDDDDEMPFVSKPCICSKSQIIARDD